MTGSKRSFGIKYFARASVPSCLILSNADEQDLYIVNNTSKLVLHQLTKTKSEQTVSPKN